MPLSTIYPRRRCLVVLALLAFSLPACQTGTSTRPAADKADVTGQGKKVQALESNHIRLSWQLPGMTASETTLFRPTRTPDATLFSIQASPVDPVPGSAQWPRLFSLTIPGFKGPGDYPVGFAWSRGDTRATLTFSDGLRCMTRGKDGSVIRVSRTSGGVEGTFSFWCFNEAKELPQELGVRVKGAFSVVVPP